MPTALFSDGPMVGRIEVLPKLVKTLLIHHDASLAKDQMKSCDIDKAPGAVKIVYHLAAVNADASFATYSIGEPKCQC